jgi:hypothetical protein
MVSLPGLGIYRNFAMVAGLHKKLLDDLLLSFGKISLRLKAHLNSNPPHAIAIQAWLRGWVLD